MLSWGHRQIRRGWILLLLLPGVVLAAGFSVVNLDVKLEAGQYLVNAEIEYELSDRAAEALENGVPIVLENHLQLRREDAWIWERDLVEMRLRYQIRYHALATLYLVEDLQTRTEKSFATRESALDAIGAIQKFPLISQERLKRGQEYNLTLRSSLDIESLPLLLRPMAYITPSWNISSERRQWHLTP
ncbi:MAG: DUF4390 domain-containing protein [Gammaproteobacteria bacterium]|nr:DUF4390 domain-containing protein [Gammaproteobacteria bacterium]